MPVFRIYTEGLSVKPPGLQSESADGGQAGGFDPHSRCLLCSLGPVWEAPSACVAQGPGFSSDYLRGWALFPKKLLKCGIHTLHQCFPCLIPFLGTKFQFPFIVLCLFIHLCMHEFIHSLFMFIHSFSE